MAYSFYSRRGRLSRMHELNVMYREGSRSFATILKTALGGNQGRYLPVAQTQEA
jgi:hypothetical protein